MRWRLVLALTVVVGGCSSAAYPAPPGRTLPRLSPTEFARTDSGDAPTIRAAENVCRSGLSPRAVSAAFRAVDDVAEALGGFCSIGIVNDDPLLWHVWCGADATFRSGHYLPASSESLACDGGSARNVFDCIGRILSRNLLARQMVRYVRGVEIVSIGSVDGQRLASESAFMAEPCMDLQREMMLTTSSRWEVPTEAPTDEERGGVWNARLSWCRAAYAAREMRRGLSETVGGQYRMGAIGSGSDWYDHWRSTHTRECPTSARVSGERGRGRCRDARRVDLFIRIDAAAGRSEPRACEAPEGLAGGPSGQALFCYSDCQTRAAIGRHTQGYVAPSSQQDLLFGGRPGAIPAGWIVDNSTVDHINLPSVRSLLRSR